MWLSRECSALLSVGGAELQGFVSCGYGDCTALHCAVVGNAGLQGFIACDCDDYTALRLAAQGCKVTVH